MKIKNLTIEDTNFFKGLAILMILFHNFFHWVAPAPGENETMFNIEVIKNYIASFIIVPEYTLQTTFSIFGHYGVQIFIFLSAYGLTKKYINKEINYFSFLKRRIIKIYIPFIISIFIWMTYVVSVGWTWGQDVTFFELISQNINSLIYKLTLVSNFIPGELYAINGPWWFVSMIIQFYILFPFLLNISKKEKGDIHLLFIAVSALQLTYFLYFLNLPILIYGTFIPHIPEFVLGIYIAKQKDFILDNRIILLSIIIFILGQFFLTFWFLTDISITIILFVLFQKIREKNIKFLNKFIIEVGMVSMFIFYINGFMRNPFVNLAGYYESWWGTIFIGLAFFTIVLFISMILTKLNTKISI